MSTRRRADPLVILVIAALAIGLVLRVVYPSVIVYLHDEDWTVRHVNAARDGAAWAPLGMPSSRGIRNAGMSVWTFIVLGLASGARTPEGLTRAVALLAVAAHALMLVIPLRLVDREEERRAWLWAIALSCTNPIVVFLERKIWAQSILPIFDVALLVAFFKRDTRGGAFAWGLVGAVVGQIHMAGFFLAPALALWTRLFGPPDRRVPWLYWVGGSALGAAPAIGWLAYLATERPGANAGNPLLRFRLEFYQYFFSDPTALASSYVVGDDLARAMPYPRIGATPTYAVLVAHVVLAAATGLIALGLVRWLADAKRGSTFRAWVRALAVGDASDTHLLLGAVLVAMGIAMTLPSIPIHRHYMLAVFPLPFVWAALAAAKSRYGERALAALFGGGLLVSIGLLAFLHAEGGAHEFGMTRERQLATGATLDEAKAFRPKGDPP